MALFGNPNAEHDDQLFECAVEEIANRIRRPIITGRWGTGKTAALLILNKPLSDALGRDDLRYERIWYIQSHEILRPALQTQWREKGEEISYAIGHAWRAEILRRTLLQLSILSAPEARVGTCWDRIAGALNHKELSVPVWERFASLVDVLETDMPACRIPGSYGSLLKTLIAEDTLRAVQGCVASLDVSLRPVVAAEPLDSATSAAETQWGLAQTLVQQLIDEFERSFQRDRKNPLEVKPVIAWHRYTLENIGFLRDPQKTREYVAAIDWDPKTLRAFINKRIEAEFRRVHRPLKGARDYWDMLFEPMVRNLHCTPLVDEYSFAYMLRHTHHTPRDLQSIARRAVERCADDVGRPIDDVVRGTGGLKVNADQIRQAVSEWALESAAFLVAQAERRFMRVEERVAKLGGCTVPFKDTWLLKRFGEDTSEVKVHLWESGFLGVEVLLEPQHVARFASTFPAKAKFVENPSVRRNRVRYYLFEYNYFGKPDNLFAQDDLETEWIIHPKLFEMSVARVTGKWPIGV